MTYFLNENINDLNKIDKINNLVNIGEYAYYDNRLKIKKHYYLVKTDNNENILKCHHTDKDFDPTNKNIINLGIVKEIISEVK